MHLSSLIFEFWNRAFHLYCYTKVSRWSQYLRKTIDLLYTPYGAPSYFSIPTEDSYILYFSNRELFQMPFYTIQMLKLSWNFSLLVYWYISFIYIIIQCFSKWVGTVNVCAICWNADILTFPNCLGVPGISVQFPCLLILSNCSDFVYNI